MKRGSQRGSQRAAAPEVAPASRVALTKEAGLVRATEARTIVARATRMLDCLGLERVEVSLALVGDDTIKELNGRFRKKPKPTDVLSFPLHSADPASLLTAASAGPVLHLGDVAVSIPTAARQAKARKRPPLDELTTLVAHGLLHLLGFDHRTDAEEREMNAFASVLEAAALAKGPLALKLAP